MFHRSTHTIFIAAFKSHVLDIRVMEMLKLISYKLIKNRKAGLNFILKYPQHFKQIMTITIFFGGGGDVGLRERSPDLGNT
jgi:hypothetical protein